jgi:hypothetical protein
MNQVRATEYASSRQGISKTMARYPAILAVLQAGAAQLARLTAAPPFHFRLEIRLIRHFWQDGRSDINFI